MRCNVNYGYADRWSTRTRVTGRIACNNRVFGDPFFGRVKGCYYTNCRRYGRPHPTHTIQGMILNGVTGRLINKVASVTYRLGRRLLRPVVRHGRWIIKLGPGVYTETIYLKGFTKEIRLLRVNRSQTRRVVLNPKSSGWRTILTWNGKVIKDLDAMFRLGNNQVVSYAHMREVYHGGVVHLDVDSRDGKKPETISIKGAKKGKATFLVYNYSNEKQMQFARPRVALYKDGRLMKVFRPPKNHKGRYWYAFELNFSKNSFNAY